MSILTILGGLCYLVMFACSIIILIAAFQESVGQGFLCLCIPFWILYFAFAKFEHEKKTIILAVWLGSFVLGLVLYGAGIGAALSEMT